MLSTIKKNLLLVLLLVFIFMSSSSFTQEEFRLNKSRVTLNAGVQFPVSSFTDSVNTGFGSLIIFDYSPPLSHFSFSFSAGFNFWKYKDSTIFMNYTYSAIPMMFGISYHSTWKFFETYLGGGIGLTLTSNNFPNFNGNRNFCYSGVAGIKYKIKGIDLVVIDINVRYWSVATDKLSTYWLGFNTGVTFNL